jgi:DNA-binding NtrC family response regulator
VEVKRVLLVSAAACNDIEECLFRAGCSVSKVDDGSRALSRVRHEPLDSIILISTGTKMDLAETALNLRDMNPALEIIILTDQRGTAEEAAQTDAVAHAIPQTRILTITELNDYFASANSRTSPVSGIKRHQARSRRSAR